MEEWEKVCWEKIDWLLSLKKEEGYHLKNVGCLWNLEKASSDLFLKPPEETLETLPTSWFQSSETSDITNCKITNLQYLSYYAYGTSLEKQ